MSRYTLLGDKVKPQDAINSGSIIAWVCIAIVAAVGIGYAITVYNSQPAVSMRIDVLTYNLTNETNARIAKDMILMYNVSQLSMDVSFLYAALNMTNNTGVQVVEAIIYLNSSVTNNTNDIAYLYSILNVTNNTGNTIVNEIIYLNQTVNSLFSNVTILQMFAITNITVGPGLSTVPGYPSPSGGFIDVNNPYVQLQQRYAVPPAMASYASVTVDVHGVVTGLSSGTPPVTSITAGTGLDGGMITSTGTISLGTAGTPGTYVYPSQIITDVHGRVVSVVNGTAGGTGTVTNINTGTGLTGGPITTTGTISLSDISGVQGGYMNPTMSVDGQGRITFITNGTMSGSGTVTSVIAGTGLSGGTITTTGTISMPNVGTAAIYTNPSQIITDAQGRVSSVTNGVTPIASISAGTGMSFTTIDSTNPSGSVSLSNIPGVQGGYSNPTMSVDGQGRITFIANGTMSGSGTVTSVTAGTGLSGGTITTTGTISMPNVGPGNGTYSAPINSIGIDSQGRITSISNQKAQFMGTFNNPATLTQSGTYIDFSVDFSALATNTGMLYVPMSTLTCFGSVEGACLIVLESGLYQISFKLYFIGIINANSGFSLMIQRLPSVPVSYPMVYPVFNDGTAFSEVNLSFALDLVAGDRIQIRFNGCTSACGTTSTVGTGTGVSFLNVYKVY